MNDLLNKAILFATKVHGDQVRKDGSPYILHPMEAAVVVGNMTLDEEIMAAALLHDTIEDAGVSYEEIREEFGDRVANLVISETEEKRPGISKKVSWLPRKKESLENLRKSTDQGARMMWIGDKLSNVRSFFRNYLNEGDEFWQKFAQKEPIMHEWYYRTILDFTVDLSRYIVWKELDQLVNMLFSAEKYHRYSTVGLEVAGVGSTSTVYRLDEGRAIKAYKSSYTMKDVEREFDRMKRAYYCDVPTQVPFGIVELDEGLGIMYEYLDFPTFAELIVEDPRHRDKYLRVYADLLRRVNSIKVTIDEIPDIKTYTEVCLFYTESYVNEEDFKKLQKLVDEIPDDDRMLHCDGHIRNIFMTDDGPRMIDMDSLSKGNTIFETASLFVCYDAFSELEDEDSVGYMGISRKESLALFRDLLEMYYRTDDPEFIESVYDKCRVLGYSRMIKHYVKAGDEETAKLYGEKLSEYLKKVDRLYV